MKDGEEVIYLSRMVSCCTGYYNYNSPHIPKFKNFDKFKGRVIHPQNWPEGFDYTGQKIVVIGSGATAISIVPEMAKKAKHVTMLQRSPTYVVSLSNKDMLAKNISKFCFRRIGLID
ncbi:MAG: NAD(P)/FAD-dependent oxidoreductase [Bdellovibrionales bacterium]